MRKLLFILILSFLILPVNAESWDDFNNLDRMWDGQKSITNKEFEEVMDALNQNAKKKDAKQRKKLIKKCVKQLKSSPAVGKMLKNGGLLLEKVHKKEKTTPVGHRLPIVQLI